MSDRLRLIDEAAKALEGGGWDNDKLPRGSCDCLDCRTTVATAVIDALYAIGALREAEEPPAEGGEGR